ncbi:MAG TPA: hypothetical protein DD490_15940 [Acidobacteria bacterium]|nr:hypothetical protein [Acidobacteriota bacterium]
MKQIESDPVIDEVREVRHRISARFDHDPHRLVAYYMELQKQFGDRLIRSPRGTVEPSETREWVPRG